MNFTPPSFLSLAATKPYFSKEAEKIVDTIRHMPDLTEVLHASADITQKTTLAYKNWGQVTNPAIFAYTGDVYKGFFARTLSAEDIIWAQGHLRILSGLYGALRPLDKISAYRLEMKAKLAITGSKNLYDFWGDRVARYVDEGAGETICVLSSDEYAKVVTVHTVGRIVTPVFLDKKPNGMVGAVPIYSKMMRGVMARWMIDYRVETPERLREFSMYGYSYDDARSTESHPAFYREVMTPLRFTP